MNAQAVALAADSAVTFGSKIKNTANKIFALSKFEPVGVMIYNNADYLGLPWETVIKAYRSVLGKRSFGTVKEYAADFLGYVCTDLAIRGAIRDEKRVQAFVSRVFVLIREDAMRQIAKEIAETGAVSKERIRELLRESIKEHDAENRKKSSVDEHDAQFSPLHITAAIDAVFGQLPLEDEDRTLLADLAAFVLRHRQFADFSGLVVAGFGRDQLFPALESYIVKTMADESVITESDLSLSITVTDKAYIVPFAQSEVVATIMDGVDPRYQQLVDELITEILREYPEEVLKEATSLSKEERVLLLDKFRASTATVADEHLSRLHAIRQQNFSGPITAVVRALPKDELAAMAETFVNLTSFKRKISLDRETVGGPIDVAVISRGDGLVWIKRKHYFDPRLNPHFFDLYYSKERYVQEHNQENASDR